MHKAFPLPVIEFPLPEEVPTASKESSHCQKKRDATAVKIAMLLKSKRNCQSKSFDSFAKDSVHNIRSHNKYKSKDNGELLKQGGRFEKENEVNNDGLVNDKENGKDYGFVGDLNGEQFPTLCSQVKSSSGNNVYDCNDKLKECDKQDYLNTFDEDGCVTSKCSNGNMQKSNINCCHDILNKSNTDESIEMNEGNVELSDKSGERGVNRMNENKFHGDKQSNKFVDIVNAMKLDNRLTMIPTQVCENGDDLVIFDDDIIELRSSKWKLTEISNNDSGTLLFKFHDEEGVDRIGFVRVLMEMDAEKEVKEKTEIVYKGKNYVEGIRKVVEVDYAWKPDVFVHIAKKIRGDKSGNYRNINGLSTHHYNGNRRGIGNNNRDYGKKQAANRFEYKQIVTDKKNDNDALDKRKKKVVNEEEAPIQKTGNANDKIKQNRGEKTKNHTLKEKEFENKIGTNKFTLLNSLVDESKLVLPMNEKEEVDIFLTKRKLSDETVLENWNANKKRYYRDTKELFDVTEDMKFEEDIESEDIIEEVNEMENNGLRNVVDGIRGNERRKLWNDLGRKHRGRIMSICDENGQRFENEEVANQFMKHFKSFLGIKDKPDELQYEGIFDKTVNSIDAEEMIAQINDTEIKNAIFDIEDDKAPGPDGFTAKFFKVAWDVVGKDKGLGTSVEVDDLEKETYFLLFVYTSNGSFNPDHEKEFIKDINKILRRFLWSNGDLTKGRAKIACEHICKPKDQGAWARDLQKWNKILMTKHVWNVAAKKDSLWVKWIHVEKLKGRRFWEVGIENNSSGIWRTLLNLSEKVKDHILYEIGNGKSVSIWHDKWNNCGPLSQFITKRDIYDARLTKVKYVAEMIDNGVWKWPVKWMAKYLILNSINVPILDKDCEDKVVWINNVGQKSKFSNSIVWKDLQSMGQKERNGRMFRNKKRDEAGLIKTICDTVKMRLMSMKTKDTVVLSTSIDCCTQLSTFTSPEDSESLVGVTGPEDSESSPSLTTLLASNLADVPAIGAAWSSKRASIIRANENTSPSVENKIDELKRILNKAATSNITIIITILNDAWTEPNSMFDLFLESFQTGNQTQKFLNHLVVAALDEKAYARCLKLHYHCYYLSTDGVDFSQEAGFMAADYLKMMRRRIDLGIMLQDWRKYMHSFVNHTAFHDTVSWTVPQSC
nr:RNA-directed DNA polymerase, eukaryota, reverse transcriptase zinc-binding domain protein [Tanacetum cinerariifolium]